MTALAVTVITVLVAAATAAATGVLFQPRPPARPRKDTGK